MSQIVMLFLTPFIMKKIGKRNTAMFGMLQDAITYGSWLTGVKAMAIRNVYGEAARNITIA